MKGEGTPQPSALYCREEGRTLRPELVLVSLRDSSQPLRWSSWRPPAELSWGQTWNQQEGPGLMVCGPQVFLGGSSGPGKRLLCSQEETLWRLEDGGEDQSCFSGLWGAGLQDAAGAAATLVFAGLLAGWVAAG
ncbi:unnamed protein product [Boreogadus saida]